MTDQLHQHDAQVLIIGGGGRTSAALSARLLRVPFPILSDPERAVYRAFGFGRFARIIQRSGTVLIDRSGTVRYVHAGANPSHALHPAELMDQLRRLPQPEPL